MKHLIPLLFLAGCSTPTVSTADLAPVYIEQLGYCDMPQPDHGIRYEREGGKCMAVIRP